MWVYYFFAAVVIWLGVVSLVGGFRFLAYVRRETAKPKSGFTPRVSLIAPCRGLDQGLKENVSALFLLDYPDYEIIFVTGQEGDAAIKVINQARDELGDASQVRFRIVIAGKANDSGQKVHNLRIAVNDIDQSSEAFVFVDSDARPGRDWLISLVAPLADKQVGAATGYRWFIPKRNNLWSQMQSVWNASIASALGDQLEKNFCWGGATAILRSTFERMDLQNRWRGTLSDDFTLTRVLRESDLGIRFVPSCLTACMEDSGFSQLLEFTTRQMKITRVYAPHLWKAALLGSALFVLVFFSGIALIIAGAIRGTGFVPPLIVVIVIFALGAGKAYVRWLAVRLPLVRYDSDLKRGLWAQLLLWPFTSALFLFNSICAGLSRRINWRGISYQLKSPTETVIINPERN